MAFSFLLLTYNFLDTQDLCDIEDELETKLGVFKVHINGEVQVTWNVRSYMSQSRGDSI